MIERGLYKHFKGDLYFVIGTAVHTETGESMVLYYKVGGPGTIWARPAKMWTEEINGKKRFERVR